MGFLVMFGSTLRVDKPFHRIVLVNILGMSAEEFDGLRPERGDGFGGIVEVDVETIRLIVVLHIAEDVVVDVTVKVYFGFNTPVVLDMFEGRMLVEDAAVPATHLVI